MRSNNTKPMARWTFGAFFCIIDCVHNLWLQPIGRLNVFGPEIDVFCVPMSSNLASMFVSLYYITWVCLLFYFFFHFNVWCCWWWWLASVLSNIFFQCISFSSFHLSLFNMFVHIYTVALIISNCTIERDNRMMMMLMTMTTLYYLNDDCRDNWCVNMRMMRPTHSLNIVVCHLFILVKNLVRGDIWRRDRDDDDDH